MIWKMRIAHAFVQAGASENLCGSEDAIERKVLRLFFATTETSQSAGHQFLQWLARRTEDKDTLTTAEAAGAQLAAIGCLGEVRRRAVR
jgi:hypothetical protein